MYSITNIVMKAKYIISKCKKDASIYNQYYKMTLVYKYFILKY